MQWSSLIINSPITNIAPSDNSNIQFQHHFHQLKELSEEEIVFLGSSAPNKSCILDPIPTSLVKSSLPILPPIFKRMVNSSRSTGHFPSPWKPPSSCPNLKYQISIPSSPTIVLLAIFLSSLR